MVPPWTTCITLEQNKNLRNPRRKISFQEWLKKTVTMHRVFFIFDQFREKFKDTPPHVTIRALCGVETLVNRTPWKWLRLPSFAKYLFSFKNNKYSSFWTKTDYTEYRYKFKDTWKPLWIKKHPVHESTKGPFTNYVISFSRILDRPTYYLNVINPKIESNILADLPPTYP